MNPAPELKLALLKNPIKIETQLNGRPLFGKLGMNSVG
jgi:hypothetical protein